MCPDFSLDNAVFTYIAARQPVALFSQHRPVFGGRLTVSHTSKTDVLSAVSGDREAVIIGFCIDSHGEIPRERIAEHLVSYSVERERERGSCHFKSCM